ncbi:MAG: helix-turn-helix domain-containing protein [Treponema sp.]|jgi:transcriptional regulator with XRE-family HTH domain|nr:helix-turn-helix domain-containing protein [Treponema sp.]
MTQKENLREFLSANIKARRAVMNISPEKLAELADVSVQMIKGIEGRRTWVSDAMLVNLAQVLGVKSFQLLVPAGDTETPDDDVLIAGILCNLRQNIKDDVDSCFARYLPGQGIGHKGNC